MASIIVRPATAKDVIHVRQGSVSYAFDPGVPKDVPNERAAALTTTLRALEGNLTSPTPVVTPTGGAATTQSYTVVSFNANGDTSASATGTTAVGPTTLDGTHFNTITWALATGATGYRVIRTVGGATQGQITAAGGLSATATSLVDNGLVATAYTPAGAPVGATGVVAGPAEV
jgi:hypothetical protein